MFSIVKPMLVLFLTASLTVAMLAYVHAVTQGPIESRNKAIQEKTMREVLPQATGFTKLDGDYPGNIDTVYEGTASGQTVGYVVALSPEGYGGKINMMVGIGKDENVITGMRVVRHSETPGLGAQAANEKFYGQFTKKALIPVTIDAITGSTITTRAITEAVNEAIAWFLGEGM